MKNLLSIFGSSRRAETIPDRAKPYLAMSDATLAQASEVVAQAAVGVMAEKEYFAGRLTCRLADEPIDDSIAKDVLERLKQRMAEAKAEEAEEEAAEHRAGIRLHAPDEYHAGMVTVRPADPTQDVIELQAMHAIKEWDGE